MNIPMSCMIAAESSGSPILLILFVFAGIAFMVYLVMKSRENYTRVSIPTQPSEVPDHVLLRSPFVQKFNRHFPVIKKALDEYPNASELSRLRDNELRFFMMTLSFVCSGEAQVRDFAMLKVYVSKHIPRSMDRARTTLYMDFIDKDAPAIAEWCSPLYREIFADSQSPIARCITAFGDLLVNQDRARDYYNADPIFPAHKAWEFEDYFLDKIVPLLIEYSKEFPSPIQINAQ